MRCVLISPLVENPHTAKLNVNSQKSGECAARNSTARAIENGLPARGGGLSSAVDPYDPIPICAGDSWSNSATTGSIAATDRVAARATASQPKLTANSAQHRRKMTC